MSSSLRLPDRAVHVFFLRELAKEKLPGKTSGCLGDLKTFQVVKEFVQPATAKSKTNFIECLVGGSLGKYQPEWCQGGSMSLLPGTPRGIGPTTYFLSHAWSYTFSGLVSLVERHYESLPDTERGKTWAPVYYWVDILAVTQHFAGDFKDHPDSDFPGVIRASKAVLFTMYPWRSPIAPTRVWCLFEALTAVQSQGVELEVLLDTGGSKDTGVGTVMTVASSVDVRAAQASVASDKAYIMGCIRDGVGVESFNAILRKRLKEALMSTAFRAATQSRDTDAMVALVKAGCGRVGNDCLDFPRVLPHASTAQVVSVLDSLGPTPATTQAAGTGAAAKGSPIPRKLVLAGRCAGEVDRKPFFAYLPLSGSALAAVARMLSRQEGRGGGAAAGGGGAAGGARVSIGGAGRRAGTAADTATTGRPAATGGGAGGEALLLGASRSGAPSRAGSKGLTAMDLLGGGSGTGGGGVRPDSPAVAVQGSRGDDSDGIKELWLRPAPAVRPVSYRPFWASRNHYTPEEWELRNAGRLTQKEKAKLQAAAEARAAKERPAKEKSERADRALLWPCVGSCSSLAVLGLYNGWLTRDDVEGLGRALASCRALRELHLVAMRPEDGYPGGTAGLTRELLAAALGSRSVEVLVVVPPRLELVEGLEVPAAAAWDLGGGAAIRELVLAPLALAPRAAKQLAELLAPLPKLQVGAVGARMPPLRASLPGRDYPVPEGFYMGEREAGWPPDDENYTAESAADLAPVLQVLSRLGGGPASAGPRAAALAHFIAVATGPSATESALKAVWKDEDTRQLAPVHAAAKLHEAAYQELLRLALQAAPQEYVRSWQQLVPWYLHWLVNVAPSVGM